MTNEQPEQESQSRRVRTIGESIKIGVVGAGINALIFKGALELADFMGASGQPFEPLASNNQVIFGLGAVTAAIVAANA